MTTPPAFQWVCQPEAEALVAGILKECCIANSSIQNLQNDLQKYTSTRLFDWLDHVQVGDSPELEQNLMKSGFIAQHASPNYRIFSHPGAQLPRIVVHDREHAASGIAVAVESIADFLMVRGLTGWIEGTPFSSYRRCCLATQNGVSLWIVERRGTELIEPTYPGNDFIQRYLEATEKWQSRPRSLFNEDEAMLQTLSLVSELVSSMGEDLAAWIVLEGERRYWQARNRAGQMQKNRQDRLGMGWANHDHHTFRSSRSRFVQLVRFFEMLGFSCRERYYAGQEAGWGAQIMENPRCKIVLFLDVDLAPDELAIDFAHQPLHPLENLGTIGLWCGLQGDSILKGGMHHLEAQFLFDSLTQDLDALKIRMMEPFSNFSYLKQAFTEAEVWEVDSSRIEKLLKEGKISREQADKFIAHGAVGSHLENLQRREGYKGFNQKNVSLIIQKTDPRLLAH